MFEMMPLKHAASRFGATRWIPKSGPWGSNTNPFGLFNAVRRSVYVQRENRL
jgi:hypothetical protein